MTLGQVKDAGVILYNLAYVIFAEEISLLLVTWLGFIGTIDETLRVFMLLLGAFFGVWLMWLRMKEKRAKVERQEMENAVYRMEKLYEIQEKYDASDISDVMTEEELDVLQKKIDERKRIVGDHKSIRNDLVKKLKP